MAFQIGLNLPGGVLERYMNPLAELPGILGGFGGALGGGLDLALGLTGPGADARKAALKAKTKGPESSYYVDDFGNVTESPLPDSSYGGTDGSAVLFGGGGRDTATAWAPGQSPSEKAARGEPTGDPSVYWNQQDYAESDAAQAAVGRGPSLDAAYGVAGPTGPTGPALPTAAPAPMAAGADDTERMILDQMAKIEAAQKASAGPVPASQVRAAAQAKRDLTAKYQALLTQLRTHRSERARLGIDSARLAMDQAAAGTDLDAKRATAAGTRSETARRDYELARTREADAYLRAQADREARAAGFTFAGPDGAPATVGGDAPIPPALFRQVFDARMKAQAERDGISVAADKAGAEAGARAAAEEPFKVAADERAAKRAEATRDFQAGQKAQDRAYRGATTAQKAELDRLKAEEDNAESDLLNATIAFNRVSQYVGQEGQWGDDARAKRDAFVKAKATSDAARAARLEALSKFGSAAVDASTPPPAGAPGPAGATEPAPSRAAGFDFGAGGGAPAAPVPPTSGPQAAPVPPTAAPVAPDARDAAAAKMDAWLKRNPGASPDLKRTMWARFKAGR